jgi:hypothetical protein
VFPEVQAEVSTLKKSAAELGEGVSGNASGVGIAAGKREERAETEEETEHRRTIGGEVDDGREWKEKKWRRNVQSPGLVESVVVEKESWGSVGEQGFGLMLAFRGAWPDASIGSRMASHLL